MAGGRGPADGSEVAETGRPGVVLIHAISLYAALFGVWLLLSGIFSLFFLAEALVSCALIVFIVRRMDLVDHEGVPVHVSWRFALYLPWLVWQIIVANFDVFRRIIDPRLPIDPAMRWVPARQRSDLCRAIFANSITLTPGTVSIDVNADRILVHAIDRSGLDDLEAGAMESRVLGLED